MNTPARPSLANVYLVVGTASLCLGASALLGIEPPPIIDVFGSWAPLFAVLVWLHEYARSRKIEWAYDWGFLFSISWPIVLPLYAVRLEGRRGWGLGGRLILLVFGPGLLAAILTTIRPR